jgi:hypothetical protein
MKKVFAILVALAGVARAEASGSRFVTVPSDWKADHARSSSLLGKMATLGHFGQDAALFEAEVYAPSQPGVALFVTHVIARVPTDRGRAARAEVDQFHRSSHRAQLAGSGITEDGWQERVDPDKQQIEASLTWRDGENHTIDISRLLIAGSIDQLIAVTGECVARDDVDLRLIKACTAALATLDPRAEERVALTLAPTGSEPAPKAETNPRADAPSMRDGSHAVLPPMTISHEAPQPDRRPVYIGGGIFVLAAIFWWNRRRRERFEREDEEPKESDDR